MFPTFTIFLLRVCINQMQFRLKSLSDMQHYNAVSSTCVDTEMKMLGIVYSAILNQLLSWSIMMVSQVP
jgi:hypothetical protein